MKKAITLTLAVLLTFILSTSVFAAVDDATFTFEKVEVYDEGWVKFEGQGDGTSWNWITPFFFHVPADDQNQLEISSDKSYKGLNSLKWTCGEAGTKGQNLYLHPGWAVSDIYTEMPEFPVGATIRYHINIPESADVQEIWAGYTASTDGTWDTEVTTFNEKVESFNRKIKDQWQSFDIEIPSSLVPIDIYFTPVAGEDIVGTVMYIDSISVLDRNGNVVRCKDINDANDGGESEKEVIIPPPVNVTGVTLDKTQLTLEYGSVATIKATVAPADADELGIEWSSENAKIARVKDGKITSVSPGTTTITVKTKDGSFTAKCTVTVNEKPFSMEDFMDENMTYIIIAAAVLVLIIAGIVVLLILRKKKKSAPQLSEESEAEATEEKAEDTTKEE